MNHYDFDDFYSFDDLPGLTPNREVIDLDKLRDKNISTQLSRLIRKLGRFYPIDKGSLAIYDERTNQIHISHIYRNHGITSSMTLVIPAEGGTLHQVLKQGYPVADNFPDCFSESIIEKKLLLSHETMSLLVIPLISNGVKLGLLSLSSPKASAFGIYLDGVGTAMVDNFVEELANHILSGQRFTPTSGR